MSITETALQAQLRSLEQGIGVAVQNTAYVYDRLFLLSGRQACWAMPRGQRISNLSEIEFGVCSQFGEDGIIEWLVSHVDVPNRRFIEFGVENFLESNCRFLMMNRNWRGFVMDGSEANIAKIRAYPLLGMYDLTARSAFITAENINSLIDGARFSGQLGLLSIDIDGNDYWVWKAISVVSPAIVTCEYNGTLGNTRPIAVPYQANFDRFASHYSGIYEGCSITALQHLAQQRGYKFVGTDSIGLNAFFVRNDLVAPVLDLLCEPRAFPPRKQLSRDANGRLALVRGLARLELIRHLPVIDVVTGGILAIGDIAKPYTEDWLAEIS